MKALRIGTDCSGIEAPIEALKQMKIPFEHKWSCDNDPYVKKSIDANYKPEIFYNDMSKRKHKELPDIDLYVCGFPCQPFSFAGLRKGKDDSRSNIMLECISVIKLKKPKVFLLENVKGFKNIDEKKPFNFLKKELENIGCYNLYIEVLNTKDYGIPQRRERLFFIGIRKDIQKKDCGNFLAYKTPERVKCKDLEKFLIDHEIKNTTISNSLDKNLKLINYDQNYIITPFNFKSFGKNICPTMTTKCGSFYHTTYKRYLYPKECLLLQGFSKSFNQVVSDSQMYKQTGNSMSVNILKVVFKELFRVCNL